MTLAELIARLEAADPAQVVKHGFTHPHSYRGDYMDIAFEPAADVPVGDMLDAARSALYATFQGWKGGDFVMHGDTWCWLSAEGDASGETIGALLLDLMLAPAVPAGQAPGADPTAIERVRAVLEAEAVVGRSALEYRGLIASALMADGAEAADRAALRDRIGLAFHSELTEYRLGRDTGLIVQRLTDATLRVLPASVDRATVLRELADQQTQLAVADDLQRRRDMAAARRQLVRELRRAAVEAGAEPPSAVVVRRATDETPDEDEGDVLAPRCDHCKQLGHSFEDCPAAEQPAVGAQQPKETRP